MADMVSSVRGCLLGMAVGDAMAYPVDKKSWDEICQDYGPNGLLGYDLANGVAAITSYTQLATFAGNGLLVGITRGKTQELEKYIALGLREWARAQQPRVNPERTFCWLAQVPQMRQRLCMDPGLLDGLTRPSLGTPETPVIRSNTPSALTAAVAVAALYDPQRMSYDQLGQLATRAVAFTHGDPETFLSGAVLAYGLQAIFEDPEKPVPEQFARAVRAVHRQFENRYPQVDGLTATLQQAFALAKDPEITPLAALSVLGCTTAAGCLAGAVYAAAIHPDNFDEGMIAAVNHSGRSGAVASLTGAILGARLGAEALPEFYLESLECLDVLRELATDMAQGRRPMRIFDGDWDQKYAQGLPAI